MLPLFHHLGQLSLGSAPSIHVHQFLVALRFVWRNAAHWCAHSRTLAMASKTPTPPICTPVAQDPPARRTPGRCFGPPKKHTSVQHLRRQPAPVRRLWSLLMFWSMRKRLKGIRTEFQRLQKNADIAAATLSQSTGPTHPPRECASLRAKGSTSTTLAQLPFSTRTPPPVTAHSVARWLALGSLSTFLPTAGAAALRFSPLGLDFLTTCAPGTTSARGALPRQATAARKAGVSRAASATHCCQWIRRDHYLPLSPIVRVRVVKTKVHNFRSHTELVALTAHCGTHYLSKACCTKLWAKDRPVPFFVNLARHIKSARPRAK